MNNEINDLRIEYIKLRDKSGMDSKTFDEAVRANMVRRNLAGTPGNFVDAASAVVSELAAIPFGQTPDISDVPAPPAPPMPAPKAPPEAKVIPMPQPKPEQQTEQTKLAEFTPRIKQGEKILSLPESVLVGCKIRVRGDVHYETLGEDENCVEDEDGVKTSDNVKTRRKVVVNVDEKAMADKLAGQIRGELYKVCVPTILGPICKIKDLDELNKVITDNKRKCAEFNAGARNHFVQFACIKAKIDSDDEATARELTYEIKSVLEELNAAVESCNPKRIREVVRKAKSLSPSFANREEKLVNKALASALEAAKTIVKEASDKVSTKGLDITAIKKNLDTSDIDIARMAFVEYAVPEEMAIAESSMAKARIEALEVDDIDLDAELDKVVANGNGRALDLD